MLRTCRASILQTKTAADFWKLIPRRHRYKKKWAVNFKPSPNCQLALNNFDAFYKPYFGDQWPSIRVSLLSLPKYCAVINKYGDAEKTASQLEDLDISNFVERARSLQNKERMKKQLKTQESSDSVSASEVNISDKLGTENCDAKDSVNVLSPLNSSEDPSDENLHKDDLNVFVPTEQVYSERDQLLREEISINSFQPRESEVEILPSEPMDISRSINAFVFPKGDVSLFPQPRAYNRIIGYYLMDAASVMPVIALDIQPNDHVLDLCAAPGGKTFLILQSLDMDAGGTLHCNDSSQSRITRLKDVLTLHFPAHVARQVTVTKKDGTELLSPRYSKVLVDVPCNSDRHVVTEDDNNLFKMSRTRDRLGLMKIQTQLLISGIKACVPGGSIVYSTCTLSAAQNDGVIQAAMEELHYNSEIKVSVQDLSHLTDLFSHVLKFHVQSRYGQIILPNLLNNFGPSYFAKLQRMK